MTSLAKCPPPPRAAFPPPKTRAVPPIYDKARSEKVRNPKKKVRGRDAGRRDADSDDDDSTDEVEEKPARPEKVTAPDPLPTRTRNGIDFSGCF